MNAVIFDMDGVLIDSERVVLEGFRYAGKKTGVPNAERMAIVGLGLNDDAWIEKLRLEFGADAMRERLERVGLLQYFDVVISGDMVSRSKPEPDIFLEAARRLGEAAAQCTVIEDSPNGLRASKRAGCRTIFVPDLWQPEQEQPELYDARFSDLDAVRALFAAER